MKLENILLEVSVLLGQTCLSPIAYKDLELGDILVLDQKIEEGLLTQIGYTDYFRATAGLFKTHKAIVIDERIFP